MPTLAWRFEEFSEIDSTNTWLAQRAREGEPEGLIVRADYQSAGRGRLNRTWEASAGSSLLCSFLLRPHVESDDLALVVAAVALSTREALATRAKCEATLKWPNDLLVGDRKLGGVLAEVVTGPDGFAVVVGVGVNLTSYGASSAPATSVLHEVGAVPSARELLESVTLALSPRRELLECASGREKLRLEWEEALSTLGRKVRVVRPGGDVEGVATGIDEHGSLLVDVNGEMQSFNIGDVVHLRTVEPS